MALSVAGAAMTAGRRDTFITFESRQIVGRDPNYNTPIYDWRTASEAWAEVLDVLPSRSESLDDSISIQSRPARIRVDEYDAVGVTADMRISIEADAVHPARVLRIISGPAFKRDTREIEFIAEELSTEGQEP